MKGKKIKKGENKSNDQPDRLVEKEIDVIFRNTDEKGYPIVARAVLKAVL